MSDLEELTALVKRMAKETPLTKDDILDSESIKNEITDMLIIGAGSEAIFLAEKDDKLIGLMVVYISKSQFTGDRTGHERFWYVVPEQRKTKAGGKLFDMSMNWFSDKGLKRIYVGHHSKNSMVSRFFKKRGFKLLRKEYYLEVSNEH